MKTCPESSQPVVGNTDHVVGFGWRGHCPICEQNVGTKVIWVRGTGHVRVWHRHSVAMLADSPWIAD